MILTSSYLVFSVSSTVVLQSRPSQSSLQTQESDSQGEISPVFSTGLTHYLCSSETPPRAPPPPAPKGKSRAKSIAMQDVSADKDPDNAADTEDEDLQMRFVPS